MNILPFVMVMLMLLTTVTYQRLQSFKSQKGISIGMTEFIARGERQNFNNAMNKKYDDITFGNDKKQNAKAKASPKLNWKVLLNPEKDPERYQIYAQIFKQLVHNIYDGQPYFKELADERPSYVDDLLAALAEEQRRTRKQTDLYNLKLRDPVLDELLYRLLKKQSEGPSLSDSVAVADHDDIRLYLASYELLLAIFGDEVFVEEVLAKRQELYRKLMREQISPQEASVQFEGLIKPVCNNKYFNYSISKTNPIKYG